MEAIVLGGHNEDIAETLWGSRSGGVRTIGSELVTLQHNGRDVEIRFSRPDPVLVYAALDISVTGEYDDTDDHAALKSAIVAASLDRADRSFLDIGSQVYAAGTLAAAMRRAGVLNARVALSLESISSPESGAAVLTISARELAQLAVDRIVVNASGV
jgi:hypothetical protein